MRNFRTPDEWARAGRKLGYVYREHPWLIGDWWVAGEKFPRGLRKAIVQADDWDGPPYEVCKQWGRIARRFPVGCRYRHLDISHHQEVAMLPDELARPLLERAQREHWIVNTLRKEVWLLRFGEPLVGGDVFDTLEALIRSQRTYRGILVDPPWHISSTPGKPGETTYPTLSNEAIARLPIPQVTRSDAFLFMWGTGVMLEHAIAIMRGWGLPYKTHLVWDKMDRFGHGHYFRMCHEVLLLGLAPDAPHHFADTSIESMLRVKATRQQHSRKPTVVHDIVRRACGNGPFLELFARQHVPGWDCFGNQLAPRDNDDQLAAD